MKFTASNLYCLCASSAECGNRYGLDHPVMLWNKNTSTSTWFSPHLNPKTIVSAHQRLWGSMQWGTMQGKSGKKL